MKYKALYGTIVFEILQEFERNLQSQEPRMESAQQEYQSMNPARRSPQVEHKYSSVVGKWEQLWAQSNIYVER